MKLSLKLLLLGTALVAVTVAWVRARQDYANAQSQICRNANRNAKTISVSEANSPPSRLTIDGAGSISSAYLMGPAGFDAIRNHPHTSRYISGLTLGSQAAISAFDPIEFPGLTWVGFDDSFDLEYETLSLEWVRSLPQLEQICIEARSTDPRRALSTLPEDRPWKLAIWTDQVTSFDAFPKPYGLSMLQLHVPDSYDVGSITASLEKEFADIHVVVWDNFGPLTDPL